MRVHLSLCFLTAVSAIAFACADSKPAQGPTNMEMVPIRENATSEPTKVAQTDAVVETQPVGRPSSSASAASKPPPKGGPKVSSAECEQAFDKYLQLMAASDPRLEGLPPEIIAQAKQMAMAQSQSKGGSPCAKNPPTRPQYDCAMAATSSAAWQQCMK